MSSNNTKATGILNVKELLFIALKKWYLLCIILAVCMVSSLLYSNVLATPLYDSTGKIYIMRKDAETVSTGDLSVSSYLTRDYENLIIDRAVLDEVSQMLDNKYSYSQLKKIVSVENPEDTRFIEISARTNSAEDSKKIVDAVCNISQEKIIELLGIDRVTIIREGNLPKTASVPNISRNLINALILGVLIFIAVIFTTYFFNDKINNPSDIKKYIEISVLGDIPNNSTKTKQNS